MVTSASKTVYEPIPGTPWRHIPDSAKGELERVAHAEGYHPLDVEDASHMREIAKVVERENYLFVVAKVARPYKEGSPLVFDDLDMFVKPDALVTVEECSGPLIDHVAKRFSGAVEHKSLDVPHLVYTILDEIVDDYLLTIDAIGEKLNTLEEEIWAHPTPEVVQMIFLTKRDLIEFRRNSAAMRELLVSLTRHPSLAQRKDLQDYYRDLYEHVIRVTEFIESYRDVLNGLFDIYLSTITNRTNEVVKVLTIYGTLALPLLVIPGLYGMNIPLPFQTDPFAFAGLCLVMVALALGVLVFFKKKGWF